MQEIREAILDLVGGHPKQATVALDMLINSHQNFFMHLTALMLGLNTQQLTGKQLTGAFAVFNTLALRLKGKSEVKDLLKMEEVYSSLKTIMCSGAVEFENKKLLHGAIAELMNSMLSGNIRARNQLAELSKMVSNTEDKCSLAIMASSIVNSKSISKHTKMQSLLEILDPLLEDVAHYGCILTNQYRVVQPHEQQQNTPSPTGHSCIQIRRNGFNQIISIQHCMNRLQYLIELLYHIFHQLFQSVSQPYQYQALLLLSSNAHLCQLILLVLGWQNPSCQSRWRIPWLADLRQGSTTVEFYQVNNMKQKALQVLSSILRKTSRDYSFHHTTNKLMQQVPPLCRQVLQQIMSISADLELF